MSSQASESLVYGLVPLLPYLFAADITTALGQSIGTMVVALFAFGYIKTCMNTGWRGYRNIAAGSWGGMQMVLVGGTAAAASMAIVRWFGYEPSAS